MINTFTTIMIVIISANVPETPLLLLGQESRV